MSEDLAQTGSETVLVEMFTDCTPGSSKQVSQQSSLSSNTVTFFTPGIMLLYRTDNYT